MFGRESCDPTAFFHYLRQPPAWGLSLSQHSAKAKERHPELHASHSKLRRDPRSTADELAPGRQRRHTITSASKSMTWARDLLTSYTAQENLESSPFSGDNLGWLNWSSQRIPNMCGFVYYFSTCLFSCRAKYNATEGILRSNTCSSKVLRSRYHASTV